jgi:hypothetical protein
MKSIAASITVLAGAILWAFARNEISMIGGMALTVFAFGSFVVIAGKRD